MKTTPKISALMFAACAALTLFGAGGATQDPQQDPQQNPEPAVSQAASPAPKVGEPMPRFRLNDHRGRAVSVGGPAEHWTVVAFYPKAATPGCTREVCSLRDAATPFDDLGVTVYGISLDDVAAQRAFHDEHELGFDLLSDADGSAAAKLGAMSPRGSYTRRVTFVVDPAGILRRIDEQVDVGAHGADLADWIRTAQRDGD